VKQNGLNRAGAGRYNVHDCKFTNTSIGIAILNMSTAINSAHIIDECRFDNIPGPTGGTGVGILIVSGVLDRIHNNYFGTENSIQNQNQFAIATFMTSRFRIFENSFSRIQNGVWVIESGSDGGFVGAGISNGPTDYEGNKFFECEKNIITSGNNENLRLKCNMCQNDDPDFYIYNFETSGSLADQGFNPAPGLDPVEYNEFIQRHGAGNEFGGGANNDRFIYISPNTNTDSYTYFHHTNVETTPDVDLASPNLILRESIGVEKSDNQTACPPLLLAIPNFPIVIPWPIIFNLDSDIVELEEDIEQIKLDLDNGITNELLNDINSNMSNGKLKTKLINNSPLSDTVITSLLIEYPLSHGNFKLVMERNMPVSKNVEPYLFARLLTLPNGISNQLYPLQVSNSQYTTIRQLQNQINFLSLEKQLIINELAEKLIDSTNNRPEDAKSILEYENTLSSKQILHSTNFASNTIGANENIQAILNEYEEAEDWVNLQLMFLSLEDEHKTLYNLNSTQLDFVRELATQCPPNRASANAQAVLFLLFGEEFQPCEFMSNRNTLSLIKDVNFAVPETDAYIEDNFPDPFIDKTLINYYLPEGNDGKIIVSDMYGRTISEYALISGENTLEINSDKLVPGVYSYGLIVNNKIIEFKKMVITQ
jgi:hypothetical protein